MVGDKMQEALNEQINRELYSEYLYLAMSAWFQELGLVGMAQWMRMQALEENIHAMKIFDYVSEVGGKVHLKGIDEPPTDFGCPLSAFEAALEHEKFITGSINELVDLAIAERDHASNNFLQWYVTEQVEEEASAGEVVDKLKLAGDAGNGLLMLDDQLGQRLPPTPPAAQ